MTADKTGTAANDRAARSGTPRYQRLAEDLLARLRRGEFPVGGMLPTEVALAAEYSVSRHTVREALRMLEELGLVERLQGSGTSVTALEPLESFIQQIGGLDELLQYPENTRLFLLKAGEVPAGDPAVARLGLEGERWLRIEGIRRVRITSAAICLTTIYVSAAHADVVEDIGTVSAPVYRLVADRFGLRVSEVELDLLAKPIGPLEADLLDVTPGTAGLLMVRRYRDQYDRVFEVSESLHPGERFTYRLRWRRSGAPHD
jgi:DNA-binding GntR family transcriptional regulator